jgi:hypothetical protein
VTAAEATAAGSAQAPNWAPSRRVMEGEEFRIYGELQRVKYSLAFNIARPRRVPAMLTLSSRVAESIHSLRRV